MPSKRRSFGRIEQRASGRWRASYVGPDKVLRRAEVTFDAKDDAISWLNARRAEITMGVWSPDAMQRARRGSAGSFGSYAETWLNGRPLKPRTYAHYGSLLRVHILPTFGETPIDQITRESVKRWHDGVAVGHPTTKAHAYQLLRTILGSAVQDQHIALNPCHIRGAGQTKPVLKTEPASLVELSKLVAALPDRYRTMALLAAWCSMRFGELTELRRRNVDTSRGIIRIRRAVVRANNEVIIGSPKSAAGTRDVAIPPHVLPELKSHLQLHTAQGRDALLFPAVNGGHMAPSTLYKVFYAARDAAGRPDLRFHDLRHTGAVLTAQVGGTLADLMVRLGHSTPGAAMRYQHAAKGRDGHLASELSKLAATTREMT